MRFILYGILSFKGIPERAGPEYGTRENERLRSDSVGTVGSVGRAKYAIVLVGRSGRLGSESSTGAMRGQDRLLAVRLLRDSSEPVGRIFRRERVGPTLSETGWLSPVIFANGHAIVWDVFIRLSAGGAYVRSERRETCRFADLVLPRRSGFVAVRRQDAFAGEGMRCVVRGGALRGVGSFGACDAPQQALRGFCRRKGVRNVSEGGSDKVRPTGV